MPRILLVEDNEMNRDMLSRRLIRRGYDVILAQDGKEGLQAAHSLAPDLILMDMSLPILDGWEATRQLKSSPDTAGIPVIALTAHALTDDREKATQAGCDGYETKPVELPRLIETIEKLLAPRTPVVRQEEVRGSAQ
jgi:two-component system, cell cycle response regulator DivK